MGLDIGAKGYPGEGAHWSYSGFRRFRINLAKEIGIDLDDMAGFGRYCGEGEKPRSWSWDNVIDPIKLLLYHSDCDGELTPNECKGIAPRLRKLISKWPKDPLNGYDYRQGMALVKLMEWCAKHRRKIEFG